MSDGFFTMPGLRRTLFLFQLWRPRRRAVYALLAFAASLCFAGEAQGCSCLMGYEALQPCGAYVNADVVFTGTASEVGSLTPVPGTDSFTPGGRVTRFTVATAFRGVSGETVETVERGTSCDYHFKPGERYFVYGSRDARDGKIYVHSCSATKTLDNAAADLAYARAAGRGEPPPAIVGYVVRETRASASVYRSRQPLEGIKVLIEGGARPVEVVTNAEGEFRAFGLPAGTYRVRALTPPDLRLLYVKEPVEVRVVPDRCRAAEFVVTSLSTISGQVLNSEGVAAAQMRLSLVAVDENNAEIPSAENLVETTADGAGQYKFEWVAPGRYLVAVNARNQPGRSDPPLPRSYYPGVREAARATPINVADGGHYVNHEFRLPPPLRQRTIEGVVVLPDGRPAAHALLTLEFTEREWIETETADAQGRFSLKVYEGFKYFVAAEVRWEERGVWRGRHTPPAEVVVGAEASAPLKLVVSEEGFYRVRWIRGKQRTP